ncbi:MAG: hypothetical protein ICCCNLDF_00922 [Planctomycetes bacterium]|nr:hypothetical protein [Planctomycetota bacterium]
MKRCLLVPLVLLLAACGPSFEQVAQSREAEVRPKLDKLREVGKGAEGVDTGSLTPIALPEGEKLKFVGKSESPNALLMQSERFNENVSDRTPRLDLIIEDYWLTHLSDAYAAPPAELPVDYFNELADRLAAVKYLVVVRTILYADPSAVSNDQFSPGFWQGDVLVYEISSGKLLGGTAANASNSETVDVNEKDPDKWLHSDLWSRTRKAVDEALKPHSDAAPFG